MKFTLEKVVTIFFLGVAAMLMLWLTPPSTAQLGQARSSQLRKTFRVIGCVSKSGAMELSVSGDDPRYIKGLGKLVDDLPLAGPMRAALIEDCNELRRVFGVNAPMMFMEEEDGSPNAVGTNLVIDDNRPDGTVFLGVKLLANEYRNENGQGWGIPSVLAHEFAHIMQYKYKFPDMNTKWQELHADYLAGWFTAHRSRFRASIPMASLTSIYNKGDYAFNDKGHHGMPTERSNAFQAGFNLNALGNVAYGAIAYANGLNYIVQQGATITEAPSEGNTGNPEIPFYIKRKGRY